MTASTVSVAASAAHLIPKPYSAGIFAVEFTVSIATTSLDDVADIVELGYLPGNCKAYKAYVSMTDMDSGSAAIVHKLTLGSTDIVTGLTNGQAGTTTAHAFAMQTLTAPTLLKLAVTTVAATAVAGTATVVIECING